MPVRMLQNSLMELKQRMLLNLPSLMVKLLIELSEQVPLEMILYWWKQKNRNMTVMMNKM